MQLGTRWLVGDEAPATLPDTVREAITAEEQELREQGVDAATWRWTLTWLERRAVVELDDGTTIKQLADGSARLSRPEPDQED
ncbi:hypothetical protein KXS11_06645 [Plantibacter flavus]|uniref:hypothetical protein n=1 Tax=Plantibacter flavus TaxID=150123 RepID=UPI003F17ED63